MNATEAKEAWIELRDKATAAKQLYDHLRNAEARDRMILESKKRREADEQFKDALAVKHKIPRDERFERIYRKAYESRHSEGSEAVASEFEDLLAL